MNLIEVVNRTRTEVGEAAVARLVAVVLEAEGVHGAEVAVEFVGEGRIRALNREYRGKDEVTDVLSFPLEDWPEGGVAAGDGEAVSPAPDLGEVAEAVMAGQAGPPLMLGDIVICARRRAAALVRGRRAARARHAAPARLRSRERRGADGPAPG